MRQVVLQKPTAFSLVEVPRPEADPGQALVRVNRIGVCGTDLHAFTGRQPYFTYPRVLGHELGGTVLTAPPNERGIHVGDRCAIEPYLNCGHCIACRQGKTNCCEHLKVLGIHTDGGMQPLLAVPVQNLHKSNTISVDQLALVETLGIGAHAVERANLLKGETVLVIGVGPIGLSVVQFAKLEGVKLVVADLSRQRLKLCSQIHGVEHLIDSGNTNLLQQIKDANHGELPTVIFDATGNARSMMGSFDLIAPGGRIVFVSLVKDRISFEDPEFHRREITLLATRNSTAQTFARVIRCLESGQIDTTPWITRRIRLSDVPGQFSTLLNDDSLVKALVETSEDD